MSQATRALVADGDADVRSVLEDLLVQEGFEVRQAANADEILLALREGGFDVLVCHLDWLQSKDGRVTRRSRELQPPLRVVALSASGRQALASEADANLPKPFTRSQLLEALRPATD